MKATKKQKTTISYETYLAVLGLATLARRAYTDGGRLYDDIMDLLDIEDGSGFISDALFDDGDIRRSLTMAGVTVAKKARRKK